MLPLSSSNSEAVWSFRLSFLERRILNTDAASVEDSTQPTSIPSQNSMPQTYTQNSPVTAAVSTTPSEDSASAGTATGFASLQRVPNPP